MTEHADTFIGMQTNENTRAAYRADLDKWFRFLPTCGASGPMAALRFREWLEATYAQSTANRVFTTVRTYHDWLRKQGIIELNPFEPIKAPRVTQDKTPKVPTDVQVERILRETLDYPRDRAILQLLLNGLRASEVCALNVDDHTYDPVTGAFLVRVVGKGDRERIVPLTTDSQNALSLYYMKDHHPQPGGPIFVDALGHRITRKQVAYVCRAAGERAGVVGFTPHSFRHHYGTRMYRVTRDVLGVGKLMGHVKPTTTLRYAHLDLSDIVETARLDPRNKQEDTHEQRLPARLA